MKQDYFHLLISLIICLQIFEASDAKKGNHYLVKTKDSNRNMAAEDYGSIIAGKIHGSVVQHNYAGAQNNFIGADEVSGNAVQNNFGGDNNNIDIGRIYNNRYWKG